jgi:hypothetical protein
MEGGMSFMYDNEWVSGAFFCGRGMPRPYKSGKGLSTPLQGEGGFRDLFLQLGGCISGKIMIQKGIWMRVVLFRSHWEYLICRSLHPFCPIYGVKVSSIYPFRGSQGIGNRKWPQR